MQGMGKVSPHPATQPRIVNGAAPLAVRAVAQRSDTIVATVRVRETERGHLEEPFAIRRVRLDKT